MRRLIVHRDDAFRVRIIDDVLRSLRVNRIKAADGNHHHIRIRNHVQRGFARHAALIAHMHDL